MTGTEPTSAAPRPADWLRLRIVATSDLHMNLLAWDYHADAPSDAVGLSRVAGLIAQARAEVPGTVLLDNGDFLQGTALGDVAAGERCGTHPMIAAMTALGYDAVGLGNHEFDYGLEVLEQALGGAAFPLVSCNALRRRGATPLADTPLVRARVILRRVLADGHGRRRELRIGVLSVLPPQVLKWDSEGLAGRIEMRCMIEAARAHVPALRNEGAEVVVLLAHCGPSAQPETPGMEHALLPLAGIPGVDAVVAGHVHRRLPGPDFAGLPGVEADAGRVAGRPVVMPGIAGSHLGVIDLWLAPREAGWQVAESRAELRPIAQRGPAGVVPLVKDAPEVVAAVAPAHAATLARLRRPVGRSEIALQSYTSFIAPCPVVHAINAAQAWHLRRILEPTEEPVLSAAAPFKCGGPAGPEHYTDIAPGQLSHRDLSALYPYPNSLRALRVTGAELKDWLERSAAVFCQLSPDRPEQPLLDPDFAAYDFDVISGLQWEIDLSRPARFGPDGLPCGSGPGRVRDLRRNGVPVAEDARFIVATNSYRIGGAGLHAPRAGAEVVLAGSTASREVLVRYLREAGTLRGPVTPCWRFAPLGGCRAIIDTGRGALEHLGACALAGVAQVVPERITPAGFQRLRLTL